MATCVLVTGGTGFLGQKLARRLLHLGYDVEVVGRNETVGKVLQREGIVFTKASLEDEVAIINACKKKTFVFHTAALSSPWGKYQDFYSSNVMGTKHVVAGCRHHQVDRLIHVSTPSIYFRFNDRLDVKEEDSLPEKHVNHYAQTKWLAEQEIDRAYAAGMNVITIRPRAIFGPGDTTILPRLIKANDRIGIPFLDGGNALMDITYVENVVNALLLCMHSDKNTLGKKYNITNGEPTPFHLLVEKLYEQLQKPYTIRELSYQKAYYVSWLLEAIYKTILLGKEPLLTRYSVSVLAKTQTLNIDAAKNELGYKPTISIDEGLQKFVQWWNENEKHNHSSI